MQPPGIGDALGAGWKAFKPNAVPLIVGCLIANIIGFIPGVGFAGFHHMCLKAVRGQKPEIGDAFIGFQKFVDHLVMGLLQMIGIILCCIGVYVTLPLFYQGTHLITDKGLAWGAAKDKCMSDVKPQLLGWIIYVFVVMIVGALGSIACGIGALVTMPIAFCALAHAYNQTLGKAAA